MVYRRQIRCKQCQREIASSESLPACVHLHVKMDPPSATLCLRGHSPPEAHPDLSLLSPAIRWLRQKTVLTTLRHNGELSSCWVKCLCLCTLGTLHVAYGVTNGFFAAVKFGAVGERIRIVEELDDSSWTDEDN